MADFGPAVETLLGHEGGLVDDPADRGGLTNFGLSSKRYPGLDLRNLTRDEAIAIYRRDYWRQEFGQLQSQAICNKLFDMSVLMSPKRALLYLQSSVCAEAHIIPVDGMWGPRTIAATNSIPEDQLLKTYKQELGLYYKKIAANDPSQVKFLKGWLNRVES